MNVNSRYVHVDCYMHTKQKVRVLFVSFLYVLSDCSLSFLLKGRLIKRFLRLCNFLRAGICILFRRIYVHTSYVQFPLSLSLFLLLTLFVSFPLFRLHGLVKSKSFVVHVTQSESHFVDTDFRLQNVRGNPCSFNHSLFPSGTEPHPPVIARNLYEIVVIIS